MKVKRPTRKERLKDVALRYPDISCRQLLVLSAIGKRKYRIRDLVAGLQIPQSSISRAVSALNREDLVERVLLGRQNFDGVTVEATAAGLILLRELGF